MKSLKRWTTSIIIDVTLAYLFYLWQFRSVDGAGNMFMFVTWFLAIVGILVGCVQGADRAKLAAGAAFRFYPVITDMTVICALAWTSHYVAAAFYALATLLITSARSEESKKKAVA